MEERRKIRKSSDLNSEPRKKKGIKFVTTFSLVLWMHIALHAGLFKRKTK